MRGVKKKIVVFTYVIVVFLIVLGIAYAYNTSSLVFNADTGVYGIDEEIYGSTTFNSTNLKLSPILDSKVNEKLENVIKIDFKVRGADFNPSDKEIIYDIALTDLHLDCQLLNTEYLKWRLVKNGETLEESNFSNTVDNAVDGRYLLTQIQQDLVAYTAGGHDDYSLYIWISDVCQEENLGDCDVTDEALEKQTALIGRHISGKVEVQLYTGTKKEHVKNPLPEGSNSCSNMMYAFYRNAGNLEGDYIEIVTGKTFKNLPTPKKDGYKFDGWYLDSSYSNKVDNDTVVSATNNIELFAKWSYVTYNIAYSLNGGTAGSKAPTTALYESVVEISNPTKSITVVGNANGTGATTFGSVNYNYEFEGWESSTVNFATAMYGNTDAGVSSSWDGTAVNAGYFKNLAAEEGKTIGMNAAWAASDSLTLSLNKIGHQCSWNTKANGTGTTYAANSEFLEILEELDVSSGTVNLYAQCTPSVYTVNYDSNNLLYGMYDSSEVEAASGRITYSVDSGNVTVTNTGTADDGYGYVNGRVYLEANTQYVFDCSFSSANINSWGGGTNTVEAFLMLNGKGTTYFNMASNESYVFTPTATGVYWLRLDVNKVGLSATFSNISIRRVSSNNNVTYGSSIWTGLPTGLIKNGYTLGGWYNTPTPSGSDTRYDNGSVSVTENDTTLYAKWNPNSYTVNFYDNNNTYSALADEVLVTLSGRNYYKYNSEPALVGYLYDNSYTGPVLVGKTADSVKYYTSVDSTVFAHSGTFVVNGVTYYYSSTEYWQAYDLTDSSGLGRVKLTTGSTVAQAAQQLLTGTVSRSQSFTFDVSQNLTSLSTTKSEYKFAGWSTEPLGSVVYKNSALVGNLATSGSTKLYAIWTYSPSVKKVTIKYSINNLSSVDDSPAITSSTTGSDGTKYTWTTDSNGIIKVSINGGTSKYVTDIIEYGDTIKSSGLNNYNNAAYIFISNAVGSTKYAAKAGAEWICLQGCTTAGKTFNHDTNTYTSNDFCNASTNDCEVVVGVNWVKAHYSVSRSPVTYHETLKNAIAYTSAGQTVTLLNSYTDSSSVTFNKNMTFNTNGYTLTRSAQMGINSGVTLTKSGSGTITSSANLFYSSGTLTVSAGTLKSTGGYAIYNVGTGAVNLTSATLTSTTTFAVRNNSTGTVNFNSGTVSSDSHAAIYNYAGGVVNIKGGTLYGKGTTVVHNNGAGTINISAGTIGSTSTTVAAINNAAGGTIIISGTGVKVYCGNVTCVRNSGAGKFYAYEGTYSSTGTMFYNSGTGQMTIGDASTTDTSILSATSASGYGLYCGLNSAGGSHAYCIVQYATITATASHGVVNRGGDYRQYAGSYIHSKGSSHSGLYNVEETYSSDGTYYWGRVYVRQGRVQAVVNGVLNYVKNKNAVYIGNTSDSLYNLTDYEAADWEINRLTGPMIRASSSTKGRGAYTVPEGYQWKLANGMVGGAYTPAYQQPNRVRKKSDGTKYSLGTYEGSTYTYFYLK